AVRADGRSVNRRGGSLVPRWRTIRRPLLARRRGYEVKELLYVPAVDKIECAVGADVQGTIADKVVDGPSFTDDPTLAVVQFDDEWLKGVSLEASTNGFFKYRLGHHKDEFLKSCNSSGVDEANNARVWKHVPNASRTITNDDIVEEFERLWMVDFQARAADKF